jgi:lipoprotein NlpD
MGFLMLSGCADRLVERQEIYVVRPQDTLYSIAWRHGLDYHDLARWNGIGPDFRISVGQALKLARGGVPEPKEKDLPPQHAIAAGRPGENPAVASRLQWAWPTDRIGAPLPVNGGGILLLGHLGQDVRAACAGRVVYSGTGIRGYGNLIIIKHGENLLSAYAHNRESLVSEGQEVSLGQLIGKMGEGAPQKPALYFEIRRNGKPVDPMRFFPDTK